MTRRDFLVSSTGLTALGAAGELPALLPKSDPTPVPAVDVDGRLKPWAAVRPGDVVRVRLRESPARTVLAFEVGSVRPDGDVVAGWLRLTPYYEGTVLDPVGELFIRGEGLEVTHRPDGTYIVVKSGVTVISLSPPKPKKGPVA